LQLKKDLIINVENKGVLLNISVEIYIFILKRNLFEMDFFVTMEKRFTAK